VNAAKTQRNYELLSPTVGAVPLPRSQWFSWCGLLIHTSDFRVRTDYSRYEGQSFKEQDAPSLDTDTSAALCVTRKLNQWLSQRLHPLLFDSRINPLSQQCINLHQAVAHATMLWYSKCKHIVYRTEEERCTVMKRHGQSISVEECKRVLGTVLMYVRNQFKRRIIRRIREAQGGSTFLTDSALTAYVCCQAMLSVVYRKHARFMPILTWLKVTSCKARKQLVVKLRNDVVRDQIDAVINIHRNEEQYSSFQRIFF
jgi:hypothetical protein